MAKKNRKSSKSSGEFQTDRTTPTNVTESSAVSPSEQTDLLSAKSLLAVMITISVIWWLALSTLTLTGANPTTVNQLQIIESDIVVIAKIDDLAKGKVTVERQWLDTEAHQQITVTGLDKFELTDGETVVLPLTGSADGTFRLTEIKSGQTYIYPPSEETIEQIDQVVARK